MSNEPVDGGSPIPPPCDPVQFPEHHHILQIYQDEFTFMESLVCFVTCGLRAGDGVVLFATARHLQDLQIRLQSSQLQLDRALWQDRYIPVLASEILHKFMVRGWPDEHLFKKVIGEYLDRAQAGGREVRAFGEIVDLLMADDELAATIRVEQLWTECCEERKLTLLCAYSRKRLPEDSRAAEAICDEHDWMLDGHRRVDPTLPPLFAQPLLPRGPKSAAGWSIAGTQHSETGTRWMLRPLVR